MFILSGPSQSYGFNNGQKGEKMRGHWPSHLWNTSQFMESFNKYNLIQLL